MGSGKIQGRAGEEKEVFLFLWQIQLEQKMLAESPGSLETGRRDGVWKLQ